MKQMADKLEKITKTKQLSTKHKFEDLEGSRWVEYATFQSEIHWPRKSMTEVSINPNKFPRLKLLDVPKHQRLYLIAEDGAEFAVPSGNIKGMVYY